MLQGTTERTSITEYLGQFDVLIGDERTSKTFGKVIRGIINAGSLVCQRIAAHSAVVCPLAGTLCLPQRSAGRPEDVPQGLAREPLPAERGRGLQGNDLPPESV